MYCVAFLILASLLTFISVTAWPATGWCLWGALDFALLSVACGRNDARFLGKRANGTFHWWALAIYLPYFCLTWLLWHFVRQVSRDPCCNKIESELWIGRRLLANEVPEGVTSIVDLTAEFAEPRGVRTGRTYRCLPILDASIPESEAFAKMVAEVAGSNGGVLIHCASGHGRSALFVAAVLVVRRLEATADDAIRRVRFYGPSVRLNHSQKRFLTQFCDRQTTESAIVPSTKDLP